MTAAAEACSSSKAASTLAFARYKHNLVASYHRSSHTKLPSIRSDSLSSVRAVVAAGRAVCKWRMDLKHMAGKIIRAEAFRQRT